MSDLLDLVPDFTSWGEASEWLRRGREAVLHAPISSDKTSLQWEEVLPDAYFGLYSSKRWRQFVLAVYLADLVSYPKPHDQVNFERLLFVMHGFPKGFRVWWSRDMNGQWWPVGYTGWYPMLEAAFLQFEKTPAQVKNRLVAPHEGSGYLYLFNYSVAAHFKGSDLSRELVKSFARDVGAQNASGLTCIAVSEAGANVAKRFGMQLSGHFGEFNEAVYVVRL